MLPPHKPYFTRSEFIDIFKGDGLTFPDKKRNILNTDRSVQYLDLQRREYDEYIAYVDFEFARLHQVLERAGVLDNTWLVLISDHGEMFERGTAAHGGPTLYQPVIQVPLIIFEPGRTQRQDIYTSTSAVDLLPTMMHLIGEKSPSWGEGALLPPFAESGTKERSVFAMMARRAFQHSPLTKASFMLVNEQYKLTYYIGYNELAGNELVELYDLENDPQEMENLYSPHQSLSKDLLYEMKNKVREVNAPYLHDE